MSFGPSQLQADENWRFPTLLAFFSVLSFGRWWVVLNMCKLQGSERLEEVLTWTNRLQSTWRWSLELTICSEHCGAVAQKKPHKPLELDNEKWMSSQKGESVINDHRHVFIPQHDLKHLNLSRLPLSLLIHLVSPSFITNSSTLCSRLFFLTFPFQPRLSSFSSPFFLLFPLLCPTPHSCIVPINVSVSLLVSPAPLHPHPPLLSCEWGSFHSRLICQGEKWEHATLRDTKQAADINGIMRWGLNIKITEGKMPNIKWTSEEKATNT